MTEKENEKFYDSLQDYYRIVYEIHNLLTVGDINLLDAMAIYEKLLKANLSIEELSKFLDGKSLVYGNLKKRLPELGGIFLCNGLSPLVLGPFSIIVFYFS